MKYRFDLQMQGYDSEKGMDPLDFNTEWLVPVETFPEVATALYRRLLDGDLPSVGPLDGALTEDMSFPGWREYGFIVEMSRDKPGCGGNSLSLTLVVKLDHAGATYTYAVVRDSEGEI